MSSDSSPVCEGGTCELFGIFGIAVQVSIALWCISVLLFMWGMETPRRSFFTWCGDSSKQLIGAGWGHAMNVFLAMLFGLALEPVDSRNQCVWYLVVFMSDIIFVTLLCWAATVTLRPFFRDRCGIDIGEYEGNEDEGSQKGEASGTGAAPTGRWRMWAIQLVLWLSIVTIIKAFVTTAIYFSQGVFYSAVALFFRSLGMCGHQRAQLVTSVIVVPVLGDAFQFVVQDNFLKKKQEAKDTSSYRVVAVEQ
mmetsp:Transcript_27060/g.59386  ORF Transcript_27060/g.59386 Transcript_27060/m.59386 type:complete len:250 (-) Transcript_27060:77-826(-)|eukprot:CAMPEP_0170611712 /NCGR_PEP_ID=MMETSP0224-20130122/23335_1 /TAXON_ID=285029 /ORGANISM="Togula jolla, Strain CCCM 725" /LENGTH=249 /DNA_ID=CAMNT_0010937165 /DNA_START=70 /DNA_END=819 /DNA_ORIENTATION=+